MRKLKFRIWDKYRNEFHYTYSKDSIYYSMGRTIDCINGFFHRLQQVQEDEYLVLQQWTGAVDQNGVEIYEGDLVKRYTNEKPIYEVKWMKAYSGYQWCLVDIASSNQDEPDDFYGGLGEYLKIVGNFLDKPQAL